MRDNGIPPTRFGGERRGLHGVDARGATEVPPVGDGEGVSLGNNWED